MFCLVRSCQFSNTLRSARDWLRCSQRNSSDSAAYQGDGKTTVRVLNDEEDRVNLINTYSEKGFRLSNKLFIHGSIIVFPTNVFSWNVKRGVDITLESLLLFDLIVPKTKIIVIGYGQYEEPHDASIPLKLKKKGISCEMLPTPNAITTYNYLVADSVHVAGAFVPVKQNVAMTNQDLRQLMEYDIVRQPNDFKTGHYKEPPHITKAHQKFWKTGGTDKGKPQYEE